MASTSKPIILHLGDSIEYNIELFNELLPSTSYTIIRPPASELSRPEFIQALKEKRWGDFRAMMRPFWNTGGEMGHWDRELISLLPESCEVFACAGTGYDWADVPIMAEFGINYCNGATASTEAVADCFIWHLLSTFRNFTESSLAARSGDPLKFMSAHRYIIPTSHNPRGHTLGIVGLGNIGMMIARKSRNAFGMKIVYTDIVRKGLHIEKELDATFYPALEDMVAICDAVVLATPSMPNASTLITGEILSHFKPGSRFINIARGSLVDSDALADALESKKIFAAGLDVFEHEPIINKRLLNMPNVELTCHNGGGALETWKGFEELAIRNVEAVLTGKKALTTVNAHLIAKKRHPSAGSEDRNEEEKRGKRKAAKGGKGEFRKIPFGNKKWSFW